MWGITLQDSAASKVCGVGIGEARAGRFFHWSGRQVYDSTDTLTLVTIDTLWSVRITGFMLATT
jgi:hypothetical protein